MTACGWGAGNRAKKPSGDASIVEEIAGKRIDTAIHLFERSVLESLDSHGKSTNLLFEESGKRDKEITDQVGEIHKNPAFINTSSPGSIRPSPRTSRSGNPIRS